MQPSALAERLARGNRVQSLTTGERPVNANHLFRIWTDHGTRILKVYGTPARERRERHALAALRGIAGIPVLLDQGVDGDVHWAVFEDAGRWNLGTLPENPAVAHTAGRILRRVHDVTPTPMSNLARGIDQEWVAMDFVSTFRRLERYRGRLGIGPDVLEGARTVRPPFASEPCSAHTDAAPGNFVVDDDGDVTLINWEWATLAPPEWDLSKAIWLIGLRSGPGAAVAFAEGYGHQFEPAQLERWTVYHAGMMLVYEAEARISGGRLDDLSYLVAELQRAITGARNLTR
jgi:aminoglycoside phosphotransferase (APT) family kinase protein